MTSLLQRMFRHRTLLPAPVVPTVVEHRIPAATVLGEHDELASPFTPYGNRALALTPDVKLRATLTPYAPLLTGVRLRLGTFARINHCHLDLNLAGHAHRINCRDVRDNEYQWIHWPHAIPWISGTPLELEIHSPDATPEDCVAVWASDALPAFAQAIEFAPIHINNTAPPRVSIVIPVYNKALYTYNCLRSVAREDPEVAKEVIVVDNASSDDTPQLLANLQGAARVVRNTHNNGFVGACRQGADVAQGEFILFLNNDTQVRPGWLAAMLAVMDADARVGVTGSKLIYPDDMLQEAGGIIFSDASGCNYGRRADPTLPYFNLSREVDYCSGASLMIRTALWQQLGGFDERYAPAYYEDTDLCFATRAAGYKVWFCHDSEVIHHEGITAGTDVNSGYKAYQTINREKFIAKWRAVLEQEHCPPGTPFDEAIARLSRRAQ